MSLVAYTLSDSEEESSEDDTSLDVKPENKCNLKDIDISNSSILSNSFSHTLTQELIESKNADDNDVKINLISKTDSTVPNISESDDDLHFFLPNNYESESNSNIKLNNFSILPPPKTQPSQFVEETDLEDEVRNKSFLNLPPVKKKEGRVKITLPALADLDSDDDDEPKKKKRKHVPKGSGLFASLPEPKNMITKEANRPLIPHTLVKKAPTPSSVIVSKPAKTQQKINPSPGISSLSVYDGGDEEDEDEIPSADFFSLSSTVKTVPTTTDVSSSHDNLPTDLDHACNWTPNPEIMDSELNFNEKRIDTSEDAKTEMQYNYSDNYNNNVYDYVENATDQSHGDIDFQNKMDYFHDKEFQKLQGKKHSGKEAINIIDVNADDQISDCQSFLTKSISEEREYRSSRKKGELPTVQQRRKHQITYLAFQAKERELELKNQWSQNRLTRKQTQSKYGF